MSPVALYPAPIGLGQGDTGGPVPGSGTAVPAGVDGVFEFNGLYMNMRRWWETYIIDDIDGLDGADIRDARELNPGFHGETAFDSLYGGKSITLSGKIRAYSLKKLRDLEQALRAALGDLQEHPLIIHGADPANDVMILCKNFQKPAIREVQADFNHTRAFQISLRAAAPFILSYLEHYAPGAMAASPTSVVASNSGNFAARPRIKLVGPLTNPVITNLTTGIQMLINGTITSGQVWEINTRTSTLVDQDGDNKFSALDVTSGWIELAPGINTIQVTATGLGVGSAFQIFWNDTWI